MWSLARMAASWRCTVVEAAGRGWRHRVRVAIAGACVAAAVLLLAACGGDDEGADAPPRPDRVPDSQLPANQRIETLDTAQLKAAPAPRGQARTAPRLPADADVERIALPPLVTPKSQDVARNKSAPMRIGVTRDMAAAADAEAVSQLLHWRLLADGTQVAALDFSAAGARALRLGLRARLPEGAMLRFHAGDGEDEAVEVPAAELERNRQDGEQADGDALYWGPTIEGPLVRLEVQLPAGSDARALRLGVPQLSQLSQTLAQVQAKAGGSDDVAGSCNENVSCEAGWDVQSRAVARVMYTNSRGSFYCTGTLLNDLRGSQTPYFLTTGHCALDQEDAQGVETLWFYRHEGCSDASAIDTREVLVRGGADWLMHDSVSDSSLLRLRAQPPADAVYAGSYFGSDLDLGAQVVGLHHPEGAVQKISVGTLDHFAQCADGNCKTAAIDESNMLQVHWQRGTTEPGSSGSALFATLDGKPYVVGTLYGGSASCESPGGSDYYGRFDRAFAAGMRDWLAAQ